MRKRLSSLISGLCLLGGLVAADALADKGDLTQKAGTAGCVSAAGGACATGVGLDYPNGVAISPDGSSLYVASLNTGGVAVFDRAADGTLTQKAGKAGCISQSGAAPCGKGQSLVGASGVAVSPDGSSVYVTSVSLNAIAVFERAPNGTLTQKTGEGKPCISITGDGECAKGDGLLGPRSIVVGPGGGKVYVSGSTGGSDTIAVLDRAGDGSLSSSECFSEQGTAPCTDIEGMVSPEELTISPDGENVYIVSTLSQSVAFLTRDTGDGSLEYLGCLSSKAVTPCGDGGEALGGVYSVDVSPDGQTVYTASALAGAGAVSVFDREPGDGSLAIKAGSAGCISIDPSTECADGIALDGAASIGVSPDGGAVYVASIVSGSLTAFTRASDGTLAQDPPPNGCLSQSGAGGCTAGIGLLAAHKLALSPDGGSVYVLSRDDSIAVFDRDDATLGPLPQPPPSADTMAPTVESLSVKPGKFLAKNGGASISAKSGAKVSYRLSEVATAKFQVEKGSPGRKSGKKCVKQTASNQKSKPCTLYKAVKGSFTHHGAAGANGFNFSGRISGKKLKPGSYRLAATATDVAGNPSKSPRTAGFTISG